MNLSHHSSGHFWMLMSVYYLSFCLVVYFLIPSLQFLRAYGRQSNSKASGRAAKAASYD